MAAYRIAGCPVCLKYNKIRADHSGTYRCGHCSVRIEGLTPEQAKIYSRPQKRKKQ